METHKINISDKYLKIIEEVTRFMQPYPVYITGGFVRDSFLGLEPKDIDFSTPTTPDEIEKKIRESLNEHGHNRKAVNVGKKFGCLKCKVFGEDIDIVSFRTEKYKKGNRKPDVEYVKTIHEDLSRRDFTINAMAIRLHKGKLRVIDPFGGQQDIEGGVIRAVGHPKQRFKEDPLRMLRAIRFACRFGFRVEEVTYSKMKKMANYILDISKERWVMELDKILLSDRVDDGLRYLWDANLFRFMIPELQLQLNYDQNSNYHSFTLEEHTKRVVMATPKDLDLRWSALLHDIAKPFVRTDKEIIISKEDLKNPEPVKVEKMETGIKTNYIGHEKLGADIVLRLAAHFKWSNERRDNVVGLVRNHLEDDCQLREYDNMGKS